MSRSLILYLEDIINSGQKILRVTKEKLSSLESAIALLKLQL
jgi:hypothetical protein